MFNRSRAAVAARPLGWFFVLAFLASWYPSIIGWWLDRPSNPNPLGVLLAAVVVAAAMGRAVLAELLRSIVRARVALRWYVAALVLPAGITLAAAMIGGLTETSDGVDVWEAGRGLELLDRFVFAFLFVGLGEEPGWRGFALRQLQRRHGALVASLILGMVWAVWHIPLLSTEIAGAQAVPFMVSVVAASVVLAWLYNGSGGSVPMTMLMHASVNTFTGGLLFVNREGPALQRLFWIYAGIWLLIAVWAGWSLHRSAPPAAPRPA